MIIREAAANDLNAIVGVHKAAFGTGEGEVIAELVVGMLQDETARPVLSLVAADSESIIGHILFSRVAVSGNDGPIAAQILAPLGVLPEQQQRGVGSQLITTGCDRLSSAGVTLVFVLGYPEYYSRFGFRPAASHGLEAPHPIPDQSAAAWAVKELVAGELERHSGKVVCSELLGQAHYWVE